MIDAWMARAAIAGAGAAMLVVAVNAPVRPARPSSASIHRLDTVGVIRQRRTDDCGIAAVAMLLRRVGTPVDLDGLWSEPGPTPRGETLRDLMDLASRHGVALEPVSAQPTQHASVRPPWIAHLSWQHYVVVESDSGAMLIVADPRGARYSYTADAFARAWSGHGLRLVSAK
jgi:ABC-type bacteriocin/lantibiotic exporter with double-glycine peptidase domain